MVDLLLDAPWWVPAALAVVGIWLIFSGVNRGEHKRSRAGAGVIAAGVVLALLSHFVDTPRKQVQRLTRQFVGAVEQRDAVAMAALLHPQAALYGLDKPEIVALAMRYAQQTQLTDVSVSSVDARTHGEIVTVMLEVTSHHEAGDMHSIPSTWQLDWYGDGHGGWLLKNILPTQIGGIEAGQFESYFSR